MQNANFVHKSKNYALSLPQMHLMHALKPSICNSQSKKNKLHIVLSKTTLTKPHFQISCHVSHNSLTLPQPQMKMGLNNSAEPVQSPTATTALTPKPEQNALKSAPKPSEEVT
jgi:hypothetical protein